MKIKKIIILLLSLAICFILLFFLVGFKGINERKWVGIILASNLNCRKSPNIGSKILASYHFGTPILLINKTKYKTKIGKFNNYWYQDSKSKGWLYAGYLTIIKYNPKKIGNILVEMIRCNMVGGGLSFFYTFKPILINGYFISSVPLTDYPIQDNSPTFGVVIGKYKDIPGKLIFYKHLFCGAYDSKRRWINNTKLVKQAFEQNKNYFLKTLNKRKDQDGYFYIVSTEKMKSLSRKNLRTKCKDKNFKKPLWVNIYTFKEAHISSFLKNFPYY